MLYIIFNGKFYPLDGTRIPMVYWGKSCPVNYTCCSHAAVHPEVCELLIEKKTEEILLKHICNTHMWTFGYAEICLSC